MSSHDKTPVASTSTSASPSQTPDSTSTHSPSVSASSSTNPSRSTTPKPVRESSTSTASQPPPQLPPPQTKKPLPRRAPSATNSPIPSREPSPVRPTAKPVVSARTSGPGRSRKNSSHDVSPSRSSSISSNPPSAAATQRALSATSIPTLYPSVSDPTIRAPIPQKSAATPEFKDTPRWPISPRLRSPPPITKSMIHSPRKNDDVPAINVLRTPQAIEQSEGRQPTNDGETEESLLVPGMRTPARGASGASSTLETVQEIIPIKEGDEDSEKSGTESRKTSMDQGKPKTSAVSNESGSDSAGKGEIKMRTTSATPVTGLRPSAPAVKPFGAGRGKASEGSGRNMTVETEVVSSIPQVAVGTRDTMSLGGNGSIRNKPSSETIRPKKEKKKTTRKTPSVASGTASSKADIFEAKVASAVDEADSSDSEETFVYESNPPEPVDRHKRYHSRTPSATSMASQIDQRNGPRSAMEGGHSVAMKKSMKFANSFTSSGGPESTTGDDDGKGTARSSVGTGRGTNHHHHPHIGRWGRNGGNGHASLFDNESPFPNATKPKFSGTGPRHSSQPTSPRLSNSRVGALGKKSGPLSSSYDLDDGADDERTPLMSSVRSGRSIRGRRQNAASIRQLEHQASRHHRPFLSQFAGWLVLCIMILLVIAGALAFTFATTQPLADVKVLALKNVLASEQDIIFDMKVQARNPNIVAVSVDMADIVIFAKSKYAGTDSEWWSRPNMPLSIMRRAIARRQDHDPPRGDDPNTNPNLEIGHVYELDSPLSFEGSPFHHTRSDSTGQIRVDHPGNHTVPSGSERWGRVLQHEFDLIVRGTLKYSLPLSQKTRSISVEGRVTVKPNAADQDPDAVHIMPARSVGK